MFQKKHKTRQIKRWKNPEDIENPEISIDYVNTGGVWNRNEMKIIYEIFFYFIAFDIVNGRDDPEPRSVTKYQNRHDWIK